MIVQFKSQHPIGIICRWPCQHCGDDPTTSRYGMQDDEANWLEVPVPMLIMKEASSEDFIREVGQEPCEKYIYDVSTD